MNLTQQFNELTIANHELRKAESEIHKLNLELEQKIVKRTAQYAFISQVNQTIVHLKDAETLYQNACRIALEFGKFKLAWIGLFDSSYKKVTVAGYCGISLAEITVLTNEPVQINGPQDRVLSTGKYFLCNDTEKHIHLEHWIAFAAKNNIGSCIVLPIRKAGNIIGTFNLYATKIDFFEEDDIKLLVEVTGDISYALDLFESINKHKEAEEIIIKNDRRFKALIEQSSDMETLATAEGKLIYASPSIFKILGYTHEEIIKMPTADIIHTDDIEVVFEKIRKIILTAGSSFFSRHRMKHKNGKFIWCEGTISNMLEEPYVNAIVSNFRDISEKRFIELQQEFERNNLNALINNTNDLMWSVDTDFNLITSNKPFDTVIAQMTGKVIERGSCVLLPAFNEDQLQRHKGFYERAFQGEIFTEIEYTEFPSELWSEISYYPIRRGDKIVGTACHSRDITKVKKAERELNKSEAFNRGVLNSISAHISVIDEAGNIVAYNEAWKNFAIANGDEQLLHTAVGSNYFDVCSRAAEAGNEIAIEVLNKLKAIMEEREKSFYLEYACHSPQTQRWFGMRAMKFESDIPMVVVTHMDITERKLAELNLLQSEAKLREAQTISLISNWEIDLITRVHTWSDELYNLTGFNRNEIIPSSESFLSLLHPDDLEIATTHMNKAFETFSSGSFNARIRNKDGIFRYIYSEWKFIFDLNNKPLRLFGILQDRTEQKKAELILLESEARLAEAQAITHISNWEMDMTHNTISWSDELYNIFGIEKSNVQPTTELFFSFIHPEDVQPLKTKMGVTLNNLRDSKSQFRFFRKDGTLRYAYLERKLDFDKYQKPTRLYGIFQDITDQKKSELIIAESEARLAEAQALAKIGSWQTDLNNLNVIWSAETFRIFEVNPDYFQSSHPTFLEYVHPEDRVIVQEAFLNSFLSNKINNIEHRIITASGAIKIVEERWQIFKDIQSRPYMAVGTCQDITERKKAEAERERLTNDIVQRNRDLEQFTFIISHNLRAPTANIIGFAENLKDTSLSPSEFQDTLKGLSLSVSGLDSVIKDINTILQIKREVGEKKEWISFPKLVNDIFISIEKLIDKHQVSIRHNFSAVEEIFSLKVYMYSIFYNLISNSIKYRQPGIKPLIEIESKIVNGKIVLKFKDNGMGIDLKTKGDKIFGLYNRFHNHVEGKGMGLFMVKTQVESIGGEIFVKSEPDQGTEFTIVFEK